MMKQIFNKIKAVWASRAATLVVNLLLALAMLTLARVVFMLWNHTLYTGMAHGLLPSIFRGGLRFDLATLFYVNGLWAVLFLFPFHWKETRLWNISLKVLFVVFNSLALLANLVDTVYVAFAGRRSTASLLDEFSHENNITSVVGAELLHAWPLVLLFILGVWGLWRLYRSGNTNPPRRLGWYYGSNTILLAVIALAAVASIRGGFDRTTRPITLSNANQYVNRPIEAAAVLNTPFSIIRSIGKPAFTSPGYMTDAEAEALFPIVHHAAADSVPFTPKNVVVLIVESFSRGYIGSLNTSLEGGRYKGFTPRLDSIIGQSRSYSRAFANGMKSIDGMPSVLSSIPMVNEPFFLTPAALNDMTSLAGTLGGKGYATAFFHGAPNGSMGFEAFARHVGFDRYVGLNEYCESPRHNGMKDFDGTWALWDEPFLQFFAEELNEMPQPFMAGVFTASSHHPFNIPGEYRDRFPEDARHPLLKCIRYTDMALGRFFETASRMPWFNNTLFVITADHSQHAIHTEYANDLQQYAVPIIFYAPGDPSMRGLDTERIAQQIDIMPTVLNYLGYKDDYVAFGLDLFNTAPKDTWAFNCNNGVYQFTRDGWFMQHDGTQVTALYDIEADPLLRNNIKASVDPSRLGAMELTLKAFIQQYCTAMNSNRLLPPGHAQAD